jgi:hypothetical protein
MCFCQITILNTYCVIFQYQWIYYNGNRGDYIMKTNEFVVTRKTDRSITMTIRIDESLQLQYDELSNMSNRSRNEIMGMALRYAIENLKFVDDVKSNKE